MALSQALLETAITNWFSALSTFTSPADSAAKFADEYHAFVVDNATAGGSAVASATKAAFSGPLAAVPPIGMSGSAWATALDNACIAIWNTVVFEPVGGFTATVSGGVPISPGSIAPAVLSAMTGFMSPSTTAASFTAGLAAAMYPALSTLQANVAATPSPYLVPVV